MTRKYILVFGFLNSFFPLAAIAEEISTAYGYTLGMPLREVTVLSTVTSEHGDKEYQVQATSVNNVETVWLLGSKDGERVGGITARSIAISSTECLAQLSSTIDDIRQRYPDSGYYALDDADMFYQKERSVIVSCQKAGKLNRLVIEYRDDLLLK